MKHTGTKKFLLTLTTLTLCCAAAFSASAEENGYWTMQHDGMDSPLWCIPIRRRWILSCPIQAIPIPRPLLSKSQTEPDAVLSSSGELPARMAGQHAAPDLSERKTSPTPPSLLVLSLGGALFLTGLGYALYRAL